MYNSIVVRFLVRIWNKFEIGYDNSFIKRIAVSIKKLINYLFFGSVTKDIFVSDKSIIEMSVFYKIYVKIIDTISKWIKYINIYIKNVGNNSIMYKSASNLFRDDAEIGNTLFTFILFFGIGILINNIFRGLWSGRSYIVSFLLILISLIGILLKDKYREILKSSFIFQFVMSFFTIDEGGINWW